MLYFLLGLTAEMIMMTVMDDTVKMNRDFYRKYGKKSPISFDVSVLSSICRQARTNHDAREMISKLELLNGTVSLVCMPFRAVSQYFSIQRTNLSVFTVRVEGLKKILKYSVTRFKIERRRRRKLSPVHLFMHKQIFSNTFLKY